MNWSSWSLDVVAFMRFSCIKLYNRNPLQKLNWSSRVGGYSLLPFNFNGWISDFSQPTCPSWQIELENCFWDVQSLLCPKLCLNTHLGSRARIWRIWIWCNLFWFLQLRQLWINKQNASKPLKWSNCTPPTWNGNNWTVKWQICNATPKHNCRKRTS